MDISVHHPKITRSSTLSSQGRLIALLSFQEEDREAATVTLYAEDARELRKLARLALELADQLED